MSQFSAITNSKPQVWQEMVDTDCVLAELKKLQMTLEQYKFKHKQIFNKYSTVL